MKCGLLGQKLGHSYSPQIHSHLGEYSYALFEKEPEELAVFLRNGDFTGLNVTIPYKKEVIPYLDELSPRAEKLGAVNTIVRRDGKLIGHNTDYFGFETMVKSSGLTVSGKKVLVLGSGGASNTAVAVLKEMGARVVVISRSGENNYSNLDWHRDTAVIVNTTPVGMYPENGVAPVDLSVFPALEGVLDVVYNPARTALLLQAEEQGLVAQNGLLMLVAQAKESAEWFTDSTISDTRIWEIHRILRRQMENVILIGMPGCGKSTIGKALAQRTGLHFVDADTVIEERAGMSVPRIFGAEGEAGFRQWETQVLSDLGESSGLVIATGGGCVTQPRNYPLLHQNGTLLWLQRNLDKLPTDGRPLSKTGRLAEMYQVRRPMYEVFADLTVDNNGDLETTISQILEVLP